MPFNDSEIIEKLSAIMKEKAAFWSDLHKKEKAKRENSGKKKPNNKEIYATAAFLSYITMGDELDVMRRKK